MRAPRPALGGRPGRCLACTECLTSTRIARQMERPGVQSLTSAAPEAQTANRGAAASRTSARKLPSHGGLHAESWMYTRVICSQENMHSGLLIPNRMASVLSLQCKPTQVERPEAPARAADLNEETR